MVCDVEETSAKRRYARRNRDEERDLSEDEKRTNEVDDLNSRTVHRIGSCRVDFGKVRATDYRHNRRIKMPKARGATEEAELAVSKAEILKIHSSYMETHQDGEDGKLKYSNLNQAQMRGLQKLLKRVKAGSIVISKTDKYGKFFVSTLEMYKSNGADHTKDDYQRKLNRAVTLWIRCFGLGGARGHYNVSRLIGSHCSVAAVIPSLYHYIL